MQLAQRLYEAGFTYMRTDSVNLSKEAMDAAQAEIIKSYGKEFSKPRTFTNKSRAQEAHEAIRPTDMFIQLI
jgi:DNA topoisomerase-1